jgi:hypothetical protein
MAFAVYRPVTVAIGGRIGGRDQEGSGLWTD